VYTALDVRRPATDEISLIACTHSWNRRQLLPNSDSICN